VPWEVAATEIVDYPRFGYRGLMIDSARNFLTVAEVKSLVDDIAAMKGNKLHWHLTDDQSWRLEIKGPPEDPSRYASLYTTPGCNGANCLTGWYTQAEFQEVVAYAAERFVEIIPEIEGPAHASRAVAQVANLSCGNGGWFCTNPASPNNANAKAFMKEVYAQLAAISPSQYVHIGADEADGMAHAEYNQWIRDMEAMLADVGKNAVGWTPSASAYQNPDSVHHYWRDQTSDANTTMDCSWYQQGFPVLLSPPSVAYLDGQGPRNPAGNYAWDPSAVYDDHRLAVLQTSYCLNDADIIGIEGPMWSESLRGLADNQYLILTSMAALIEKAWTPQAKTQQAGVFLATLAKQSARWSFEATNYRPDSSVAWDTYGAGSVLSAGPDGVVSGELAALSSTTVAKEAYTATIDWGDGSASQAAVIAGSNAGTNRGPTLFTVSGSHTYSPGAVYAGTVAFVEGANTYSLAFQVTVAPGLNLVVSATPRCMGGKAYVNTSVRNDGDMSVDVATVTPYGSKTAAGVTPGRSASGSFNSRLVDMPPGVVEVEAVGADQTTFGATVPYPGLDCG
jgi:hexosaminidase